MSWVKPGRKSTRFGALLLLLLSVPAWGESVCRVTVHRLNLREAPSRGARSLRIFTQNAQFLAANGCDEGWVRVVSEEGETRGFVGGWAVEEVAEDARTPVVTPIPHPAGVSQDGAAGSYGAATGFSAQRDEGGKVSSWRYGTLREEPSKGSGAAGAAAEDPALPAAPGYSGNRRPAIAGGVAESAGKEISPSNEHHAVQITENRLKILALERRMQKVEHLLDLVRKKVSSGERTQAKP